MPMQTGWIKTSLRGCFSLCFSPYRARHAIMKKTSEIRDDLRVSKKGECMIRHIVMFRLQEEGKAENLKKILAAAEGLKELPGLLGGDVVVNAPDADGTNYDFALVFDFADLAALDAYQKHPVHVEFVKLVLTCKESRACIDCEIA